MQTHMADAELDADGDDTANAHAVLLSEDLFSQALWRWLDVDSKAALRGVSKQMRSQVDGSITRVASPRQGFVAADLTIALLAWPALRHLTLLNVGSGADLAPLSTASLAGLTSLTVREVGIWRWPCMGALAWSVLAWRPCAAPARSPAFSSDHAHVDAVCSHVAACRSPV
jgi:hypothetical protein